MRTAIVTGVSRGLGEALVSDLLASGWTVVGLARTAAAGSGRAGFRFIQCDLADTGGVTDTLRPVFEALAAERASSVCLINNAATIDGVGVLGALDADAIAGSLAVNLVAPTLLANLFCRMFRDGSADRRIINISSGAAQSTLPGEALYCVAKAGLEMLTRAIAAEQPPGGVCAITLRPGVIDTAMQTFARAQTKATLPSVDLFKGFHANGQLVPPAVVARKVVARLVDARVENGRTYNYAEL